MIVPIKLPIMLDNGRRISFRGAALRTHTCPSAASAFRPANNFVNLATTGRDFPVSQGESDR